jgi:hypothetical protein
MKLIFPIKGLYYYDANEAEALHALKAGAELTIHRESDNPHDANALQIHLKTSHLLLGYVPRLLARTWQHWSHHDFEAFHPSLNFFQNKSRHLECTLTFDIKQLNWPQKFELVAFWLWMHFYRIHYWHRLQKHLI